MTVKKSELKGPIVRWTDAVAFSGVGQTKLREMIQSNVFPKPFKISDGGRAVAFLRCELDEWLAARVAARTPIPEPPELKAARAKRQPVKKKLRWKARRAAAASGARA